MATAQDRLKVAFNILSRNSIDSVDLYGEIAKTEALLNGMASMAQVQPPAAQIPTQMPVEQEQMVAPQAPETPIL